jgi:hypothetical protein
MDTLKLGQIIEQGREATKDATHIAVAPVAAHCLLRPGDHVGVKDGVTTYENAVGIIDPFLRRCVEKGELCWLYLYPGSITSLHHEWTHPAFVSASTPLGATDKSHAESWLRQYAARFYSAGYCSPFETLIEDLNSRSITYRGTDMHSFCELEDADELRKNASIYLGREIRWEDFEYFSCTC